MLEQETSLTLFDWIRDYKDFEIRQTLSKELAISQEMLAVRDNEIIELLLKLEDFELKFYECEDANFQSGLSGSLSQLRSDIEVVRER